jgi:hypothetical protein
MNKRIEWEPLEVILDAYLEMIEQGKIRALPEKQIEGLTLIEQNSRFKPWMIYSYTEYDLERALDSFSSLTAAIEQKISQSRPSLPTAEGSFWSRIWRFLVGTTGLAAEHAREPLADQDTIRAANITSFAKEFLSRATKPTFRCIAPGIAIQTAEELRDQPYLVIHPDPEESYAAMPILLFRGPGIISNFEPLFGRWWDELEKYPPGLYLEPVFGPAEFADSIQFVLPYGIGGNGFARVSDGGLIGEVRDSDREHTGRDKHNELYSKGWNPFIFWYGTKLYLVFDNWKKMVDEGHWQVDENGVAGGIEKYREADTEERCDLYTIPMHW